MHEPLHLHRTGSHLRAMLGALALALAFLLPTACGSTTTCGPGTVESGGECVPADGGAAITCGPGTIESGGQCVTADGGAPITCGPGTVESGGECVPADGGPGITCGPGTVESGGQCVAADAGSSLTCGPGTHLEGAECLPGDPIDAIEITPSTATVSVNGTTAFSAVAKHQGNVVSGVSFTWSATPAATATIDATGMATGVAPGVADVTASAQGITSAAAKLTVVAGPLITGLKPMSGPSGLPVEIDGMGFGATQGSGQAMFGATAAAIVSWSDTAVVARVPNGSPPGAVNVQITQGAAVSNQVPFTVLTAPYVLSVSPRSTPQGGKITLRITGADLATCTVAINRNGAPDPAFTIDNANKVVDQFGAPGLPDMIHLDVDVAASAALGQVAVSCGASTTVVTPDDVFTVVPDDGTILGVAGTGAAGFGGDGSAVGAAQLSSPGALALGPQGELYIADTGNNRVRVANLSAGALTVAGVMVPAGTIATIAGGAGTTGNVAAGYAGDGGPAVASQLSAPSGLAYDPRGLLFVADTGNHCVRVINLGATAVDLPGGTVGAGAIALVAGAGGMPGYFGDGGPALPNARFNGPMAVAVDASGLLYVADTGNNRLRVVNVGSGDVTNGLGTFIKGNVALVAGSSAAGSGGDGAAAGTGTQLDQPAGLFMDDARGVLYVADTGSHKIRAINTTTAVVTLLGPPASQGGLGKALSPGFIDLAVGSGASSPYAGDGQCPLAHSPRPNGGDIYDPQLCTPLANLSSPVGVTIGPRGELFIADQNNNRVRLAVTGDSPLHRAGSWYYPGEIDLLAGDGTTTAGAPDPQPAKSAQLFGPLAVAYDAAAATLYVADTLHHRIRKVVIGAEHDAASGELGAWPGDFVSGAATLDVDAGSLSYTGASGPTVLRLGPTGGVFSFAGKLRIYSGTTLTVVGSRPAVLAATGDVQIDGTIIVDNGGLPAGPGTAGGIGGPGHGVAGVAGDYCYYYEIYDGGAAYGNATEIPVTPGSGTGGNVAGALVIAALGNGKLTVSGAIHADSGTTSSGYQSGGSGGGLRVVSDNQIQVTGTLTAMGGTAPAFPCGTTDAYQPAAVGSVGRIRLEAPSVSATGTITPAASSNSAAPAPQPWM